MKILHLGKFFPPAVGGIETVIGNIISGFSEKKINITVLCAEHRPFKKSNEEIIHGSHILRMRSFGKLLSTAISPGIIVKLFQLRKSFDVIHVHVPDPMAILALWLVRPKSKIILYWHSDIIRQKWSYWLFKPLESYALRVSTAIVVASPHYAQTSVTLKNVLHKVKVIPYGILPLSLVQTHLPYEKKIIFSLGRFVSYKGFEYLIEAARYLDDSYKIYIGGDGPLRTLFQERIQEWNLQNRVLLLGSLSPEKALEYFNQCDVFCLPSVTRAEAFGIVLLEAMSVGKPLISTNIEGSGVQWINQNELTGRVVDPCNAKALGLAIAELLNDEKKYQFFSENAKKRYQELFTREIMINNLLKLYEDVYASSSIS